MDRMRESVFAFLGNLDGFSFLDLFSGSGIIALEAASRGASPVEAVESDPLKRKTLIKNVSLSPVRISCRFMPVELYIKRAKKGFDYIFCDPPFPYGYKGELLRSIADSALTAGGAMVILHRPRTENLDRDFDKPDFHKKDRDFHLLETRLYGASAVDFFAVKEKIL
jgi:16S rRNA (guanine(966)-N(2))-methyltransferase RsmD